MVLFHCQRTYRCAHHVQVGIIVIWLSKKQHPLNVLLNQHVLVARNVNQFVQLELSITKAESTAKSVLQVITVVQE